MGFSDRGAFYYNLGVSVVDVFEASLDLAKGTVVDPPKKVTQGTAGMSSSAEWSPDGRYLAYVSERKANSYILCIRSEQTGQEREIPLAVDSLWRMHWSTDSGAVFATMGGKTTQGLFKIDLQTGSQTLLARSGWSDSLIKDFAVSPDGKSVYYAHFQWVKKFVNVIRYSLETGQETEVYRKVTGPDIGAMTVSPDGKYLSFSTADESPDAGFVIRILPTAGGPTRIFCRRNTRVFHRSCLTPDGKTILFIKRTGSGTKDEKRELWQADSSGGEPRTINVGMELREMRLHPDGRRIVFTSWKSVKEVWVMENFLPGSKGGK
jgi:Tol biopolymer transport system component